MVDKNKEKLQGKPVQLTSLSESPIEETEVLGVDQLPGMVFVDLDEEGNEIHE